MYTVPPLDISSLVFIKSTSKIVKKLNDKNIIVPFTKIRVSQFKNIKSSNDFTMHYGNMHVCKRMFIFDVSGKSFEETGRKNVLQHFWQGS